MCGLFGAQSRTLSTSEIDALKELGVMASLRGRDSTGIGIVHKQKGKENLYGYRLKKHPTNATDFLYSRIIDEYIKEYVPFVIAGHCRWATVGSINKTNSHPFLYGSIIGMHNGTVPAYRPDKAKEETESDSSNLFKFMSENNAEEAIVKGKDGAMALVWIDLRTKTINFFRNKDRPLFHSKTSSQALYWSSEAGAINYINIRSHINFDTPTAFDTNKIYTYELGGLEPVKVTDLTEKLTPKTYVYKPTEVPRLIRPPYSWDDAPWEGRFQPPKEEDRKVVDLTSFRQGNPVEVGEHAGKVYLGYNDARIAPKLAATILNNGCAWCSAPKTVEDQVAWVSKDEFVCDDCLQEDFVKQYFHVNPVFGKLVEA